MTRPDATSTSAKCRFIYARSTKHFFCNLGSSLPTVLVVVGVEDRVLLEMDDSTENDGLKLRYCQGVCLPRILVDDDLDYY